VAETRDRLLTILERQFGTASTDGEEVAAGEHAGWDSIALINLILAIEQEFGIVFTPEEAAIATSFQRLLDLVVEKAH
jgi:acyl carrier protein